MSVGCVWACEGGCMCEGCVCVWVGLCVGGSVCYCPAWSDVPF